MTIASRYTVEEFGNDVRKMLDSGGTDIAAILRLGHLLQRFGAENSRDYFWSIGEPATISSGLPGQKLYDAPDGAFRLLLAPVPAEYADRYPQPRGLGRHRAAGRQRTLHLMASRG